MVGPYVLSQPHTQATTLTFQFVSLVWNEKLGVLAKQPGGRILLDFYSFTPKLFPMILLTSNLTAIVFSEMPFYRVFPKHSIWISQPHFPRPRCYSVITSTPCLRAVGGGQGHG